MIYEAKCPICGKINKLEVDDTAFMAYKAGVGKFSICFLTSNLKSVSSFKPASATHAGTTCFRRTKNDIRNFLACSGRTHCEPECWSLLLSQATVHAQTILSPDRTRAR